MKKKRLSAIWARDLKRICQSCPQPNTFKEYRFEGPNNQHAWRADMSLAGPALDRDSVNGEHISAWHFLLTNIQTHFFVC
jgi:hypothetical protein